MFRSQCQQRFAASLEAGASEESWPHYLARAGNGIIYHSDQAVVQGAEPALKLVEERLQVVSDDYRLYQLQFQRTA